MRDKIKAPIFSIGIPVFNGEDFIQRAVESVIQQSLGNWELIISDNASTDSTWEILQDCYAQHPQIQIISQKLNIGLARNLNQCMSVMSGEWLGFLPADDAYMPGLFAAIESQFCKCPQMSMWVHSHVVYEGGKYLNTPLALDMEKTFTPQEFSEILYTQGNIFGELSSFFFKKNSCRELVFGRETPSLDARFWLKWGLVQVQTSSTVYFTPHIYTKVLIHPASESSRYVRTGETVKDFFDYVITFSREQWSLRVRIYQSIRVLWVGAKICFKGHFQHSMIALQAVFLLFIRIFCLHSTCHYK